MSGPFFSRSFRPREPLHRRNGKIRAREVRVIDDSHQQLGVMALDKALQLAREKGLDLIEVAATAQPPVCRIANYGKFLYEDAKKSKSSRNAGGKLKEIQISPVIEAHDLAVKREHVVQFLSARMKVKVKMRFRGRQKAHKEIGLGVMNRFVKELEAYCQPDSPPKMLGDRDLSVVLSPFAQNKRLANPHPTQASTPISEAQSKNQVGTAERSL